MQQIAATRRLVCTASATSHLLLFCCCDMLHEFKPVWICATDRSNKILLQQQWFSHVTWGNLLQQPVAATCHSNLSHHVSSAFTDEGRRQTEDKGTGSGRFGPPCLPYNSKYNKASSNHRLESAGLNALEELLFKMLEIGKMVMRALFWKCDRKLALLLILTKFGQSCQVSSNQIFDQGRRRRLQRNVYLLQIEAKYFRDGRQDIVRIQRVIWDHLLAFKGEIIQKRALFSLPCWKLNNSHVVLIVINAVCSVFSFVLFSTRWGHLFI